MAEKTETDAQKLKRLASARISKCMGAIRQIKNLARLEPTPQQTEAAFTALKKELDGAYVAWKAKKVEKTTEGWQLPG
jgi:hypothetical protein